MIKGISIAGKTGTAEIKASKDDVTGTELGWFNAFTVDENSDKQYLIIAMIEDVKSRGEVIMLFLLLNQYLKIKFTQFGN